MKTSPLKSKGEYVLSLFSFDEIDCIVEIWQQRLADTEPYWEVNWEVLDNVLEDDYQLSALDEYGESEIKEYIKYRLNQNGLSDDALSIENYFKAKKKETYQ